MKESIQDSINPEETNKVFIDLKVKLEEAKMIEETLRKQLEEKERIQVELENEIVSLRGNLQSKDIKQNFDKSTKYWIRLLVAKDQSMTSQDWDTIKIILRWAQVPW